MLWISLTVATWASESFTLVWQAMVVFVSHPIVGIWSWVGGDITGQVGFVKG